MPSYTKGLKELEGILQKDPKAIDDYSSNPFGILVYDPREEFILRQDIESLRQKVNGRVCVLSLADLLREALEKAGTLEEFYINERDFGFSQTARDISNYLEHEQHLTKAILQQAQTLNPDSDVLFLIRAGILYPFDRVNPLLEGLIGKTRVPTILCYPGSREGISGLRFLGIKEAIRGYRQRIFA